jgi:hypothetical protein
MADGMLQERDYTHAGPQVGTPFPDVILPNQSRSSGARRISS